MTPDEFAPSAAALQEVERACAASAVGWATFRSLPRLRRAELLRAIAAAIRDDGDTILPLAAEETRLPPRRLSAELERTAAQAELFATVVAEGSYLEAAIDHGRDGLPELRQMQVPLGPVAVFAAGNFPLAFSVMGGDTASALAAGCSVVVKTHPDHPRTSRAVLASVHCALRSTGIPASVVEAVSDPSAGAALVADPRIAAGGFTGSLAGGRELFDIAARRRHPIPFFAEMSSINPVIVTPKAARNDPGGIGGLLADAILGRAGQLCTKPGVLLVPEDAQELVDVMRRRLEIADAQPMLSPGIAGRFADRLASWQSGGARSLTSGMVDDRWAATPTLAETTLSELDGPVLEEAFGPAALIARYDDLKSVATVLERMGGQLTTTFHLHPDEIDEARPLLAVAALLSGRVLVGGVPTGVRVGWATTHGGPYPATTAPSSTSVGASAIGRWLRPVTWQDVPQELLPDELRDVPRHPLPRRVDGQLITR
ncbi:aldehyde dehydrogenase family protein [Agromyces albus]|uniref:aldehyde dehydrogenase family protein n=1 Tax=Agromyces albus TaxID=205332 RepID=UPI002788C3ED|nr:aldehyde dehydrogenase family protein [Agromyces albus]MDQ0573925.1 NADP-dependent aldehyde dehydrogenase [Agromyces albus]